MLMHYFQTVGYSKKTERRRLAIRLAACCNNSEKYKNYCHCVQSLAQTKTVQEKLYKI